jgi:hypothetical protein
MTRYYAPVYIITHYKKKQQLKEIYCFLLCVCICWKVLVLIITHHTELRPVPLSLSLSVSHWASSLSLSLFFSLVATRSTVMYGNHMVWIRQSSIPFASHKKKPHGPNVSNPPKNPCFASSTSVVFAQEDNDCKLNCSLRAYARRKTTKENWSSKRSWNYSTGTR